MLIVRVGAMGDVLHAMPAVSAMRRAHPDWWIGWVIEPRWMPLLCNAMPDRGMPERGGSMPLVDAVYLAQTRNWKRHPFSPQTMYDIKLLRGKLRGDHYDLCVDMQGSIRSAVIGRMAGADEFVGEANPRERPAAWLYHRSIRTGASHVIEQGCELLGTAIGETLTPARVELPLEARAEERCLPLLESANNIVLIAPGAGWGAKQWPAERYGAVAAGLAAQGYRVLVSAYSSRDALGQAVVEASHGAASIFPSNLAELIAITRRASLVIAGDTGPLHLAAALERPVVALFGPTDPARNGPYGTRSRVLRHGPERRDHRRLSDPEEGLLAITVEEVIEAAVEMLR
ncbi:MAG: glycosyltransferase family 9 protein [Edaphobacter sp.]|uniref:glycosyltransferase family 9 protein n=1 Tax=Edaphobacter sp. TaxID=1934404 RepID=UPI0023A59109|nr:glycosyltransferase family 9 protein [Edaphobacter sp.]MDE1176129.1 glycosyltransferase family 9 protein [Edaphobacter sp.]